MSEPTSSLVSPVAEEAASLPATEISATFVQAAPEPRASEDQLPTSRLPSIPGPLAAVGPLAPLPPLVPPQGPALKTQPLRALSPTEAGAHLAAEAKRLQWSTLLSRVRRAASIVPTRFSGLRTETWTERRVGAVSAVIGLTMVVGGLVAGWVGVTGERMDTGSHVALAVSIVAARAAIAIAALCVGHALLRMGERLAFPASGSGSSRERDEHRGADARRQS